MIGRRSPLLVAALLCGALVAGCRSSGSSTTSGSTATSTPVTTSTSAPSSPAATGTTSTPPTTTPSAAASGAASAAGVAQYVAICKSVVQREPALSATVKAKVEGICNKAAHGDLAGAREASKEVCVEVINASPLPAAAKEKALAACKKTG
jgi:hypothetical protein